MSNLLTSDLKFGGTVSSKTLPFYRNFQTWDEVMLYARSGKPLYYQGPLDARSTKLDGHFYRMKVQKRTIRIIPPKAYADPFTADKNHLSRFSYPIA